MAEDSAVTLRQEPVMAFIALGGNLGDASATLKWAIAQMQQDKHLTVLACSSLYQTEPMESDGADYINAVVKISTRLPAYSLLRTLQHLEQRAGRERPYRNAPRTLDLDLLLYGDAQIQSDDLIVPHPRMGQRAFVLIPLLEISPERVSEAQLQLVRDQSIERFI
jgi:2-amino-4-hydroxy-6-hydroxymethyldihydropteridine diphosphokinase